MDQQTVDKVLGFLRDAAGQLGVAFEYAYPAVVRYIWAQAIGTTLVLLAALVGMWMGVGILIHAARGALQKQGGWSAGEFPTSGDFLGLVAVVSVPGAVLGSICILSSLAYWLPVLIAPEGATIMQLLGKAAGGK